MFEGLIRDWPKQVCYGPGSVARLPEILAGLGRSRAFVICGRTVASGAMLQAVQAALGDRLAGVYDRISQHTPSTEVQAAAAAFDDSGADAVVSVGGGSVIDTAKAVSVASTVEWNTVTTPPPRAVTSSKLSPKDSSLR